MILQALTRYYEDLLSRGEIAAPGWAPAKISLALYINENGELTQIVPTMVEGTKGKKTVMQPQLMVLPAAVKRTVSIASNFLWDNSAYLLGIDQKGKPERSRECFAAAAKLHHAVLDGIDSPNARAILAFFDTWEPERAAEHPALIRQLDDVTAGGNLVFRVDGRKIEEDVAIREAWQRYRDGGESGVKMQCLVTGKEDEIAAVHPSVKGVRDAQSSGAALVSFNAPAFCSYGREQNYNAPVGKYAAFAYTAALNHLLADSDHVQHIGDTTVVCWAEGADDAYPGFFSAVIGGGTYGGLSDNDLRAALKRLANGLPCDDLGVDPNRPFYILGLAPNAARLSVRFFLRDSFGKLMENVNAHYARLERSSSCWRPVTARRAGESDDFRILALYKFLPYNRGRKERGLWSRIYRHCRRSFLRTAFTTCCGASSIIPAFCRQSWTPQRTSCWKPLSVRWQRHRASTRT